jgi:hypothetical protein
MGTEKQRQLRDWDDEDLAVNIVLHRRTASEVSAYYAGARVATRMWAHWKDGVQFVGSCGTTLAEALDSLDQQQTITLEELRDEEATERETRQIIAQRQERES